jgi:hypothetical protein
MTDPDPAVTAFWTIASLVALLAGVALYAAARR